MKNTFAVPPRPGTSVGMAPVRPDRTVAQPTAPGATQMPASVDSITDTFTYFTQAGIPAGGATPILYNGDRQWAKVTLLLETAGPVVVGTKADLAPILSGKGSLLQTGVEWSRTIAKGVRLYIVSTSVNRVSVTIEPLPWLEQIVKNTTK